MMVSVAPNSNSKGFKKRMPNIPKSTPMIVPRKMEVEAVWFTVTRSFSPNFLDIREAAPNPIPCPIAPAIKYIGITIATAATALVCNLPKYAISTIL